MIFRLKLDAFKVCILLLVIVLFRGSLCLAQRENVWTFGSGAGLDFSTQPPSLIFSSIDSREGCASVCDENGELLFYTDGSVVFDRLHNLMPNGTNLTGHGFSVTQSSTQGAMIVPFPDDSNKFYIFSMTPVEIRDQAGRLYYSVVDMSLNNGLGDIIGGVKGIFLDSGLTEQLTSTPAIGKCGIWVLSCDRFSYDIKAFLVDQSGVNNAPAVSPAGYASSSGIIQMTTGLAVSPDGTRLVDPRKRVVLYEFDATTGTASSAMLIDSGGGYMPCFSPDGTKLYVDRYQYDLNAGSLHGIYTSKTALGGIIEGFRGGLKLGPDGKLYMSRHLPDTYNAYIDVIHFPNLGGTACQYEANAISMAPASARIGLPNIVSVAVPDTVSSYASTDKEGECFVEEVTLEANEASAYGYRWSTGDSTVSISVFEPGTYWVGYYTPCKFNIDTFHVTFQGGVLPSIVSTTSCHGTSNGSAYATTYPGDPVRYMYTWLRGSDTLSVSDTLSDVPSGSYSLHVQTDTGCDTLLYFDIPEVDFRVSFAVSDTISCLGGALQFQNTSDTHFTAFYWALGNGESYSVEDLQDYHYPNPGAYQVLLAGEGAICRDTVYQTVVVDEPISPYYDVEPEAVCVGQPVHLMPHTDSTTTQLEWELSDQARIEAAIAHQYHHAFDQAGVFPVTLTIHSRACPDTSYTDSIRVFALPEVDLGSDTSICLDGAPVYLTNLREAPLDPSHQVWNTGDTTAILKVVHPGIYTLNVTTEPLGCTTTESIEISKDCYVDIPNAFTPNGDGHNDYFFPRQLLSESVNRFHMQVFNRWGQVIFETHRPDGRGWDGRVNDKVQPMGVYLYRIETDFTNGRREQYEGNVTLIN